MLPAIASHPKPADATAHQQNPQRMGEFVSEDVDDNRAGQADKGYQPEDRAQRKKPKFFTGPEPLCHGRARKDGEKRLTENCTGREQKNRENKLHPTGGNCNWIRRGNESCRLRDIVNNFSAAVGLTLCSIGCRSSLRCSQGCPQITQTPR
jgi:hypothetical protein